MSTTRHLVNRRKRLSAAQSATETETGTTKKAAASRTRTPVKPAAKSATKPAAKSAGTAAGSSPTKLRQVVRTASVRDRVRPRGDSDPGSGRDRLPVWLAVAGVLLCAFAVLAGLRAGGMDDGGGTGNAALTDTARTSEVKGSVTNAVNEVFSINYADIGKNQKAAQTYLVGKAVGQHEEMLKQVRADAPKQKLVLTTTVTDSGVEMIEGDRARLLIYADQRNTRTDKDETTYAAAMFAVNAVKQGGDWKISDIDTFNR